MKPFAASPAPQVSALLAALLAAGLTGCGPSAPPVVRQPPPANPPPYAEVRREARPGEAPGVNGLSQKQRQAEFLNRIREADPQHKTIDRAVLNGQNELGLVLDRSVSMDSVPALMRTMLAQMAKEFPGQNLEVVAFAPSTPPLKIGTARLDARTRDMTYTPEHP